jgi:putative nucleotidyltransferase with HDIG domain
LKEGISVGIFKNIIRQIKSATLRTKIIIMFLGIMAVLVYQVSFSTRHHLIEHQGQLMVNDGLKVAHRYLDNSIERLDFNMRNLAYETKYLGITEGTFKTIIGEIKTWDQQVHLDMFFYIATNGTTLYSQNNNYSNDLANTVRIFSSLESVKKVVSSGKSTSGVKIIPKDVLVKENLLDKAKIKIIFTPNAEVPKNSYEERAMMLVSAQPVKVNGKLVGVIVGGQIINNNFSFVDSVDKDINVRTTIFLDNVRVSTTVPNEKGEKAVGTLLSIPVQEQVIKNGKSYFGRAYVVKDWYLTAYEPIRDLQNKVIGVLYVGIPEEPLLITQQSLNNEIMITLLVLTMIFVLVLYYLYRSVVKPITNLSNAAISFAGGNMGVRLKTKDPIKCWEIKECFNKDCPAYGKEHLRCWLIPDTKCFQHGSDPKKEESCNSCNIYQYYTKNEIESLSDVFNYMAESIYKYTESLQNLNLELEDKNNILRDQRDEMECQKEQLMALNEELEESMQALDDSQSIIYALAVAVEAKDPYTRGHSERVAEYSIKLAKVLGLSFHEFEIIRGAAFLHDIGKIGISGSILRKPGALSATEFQIVKKHTVIGEKICSSLKFARMMLPIIKYHHEHYNGKGYPEGLKGEKIPMMARIVAIADGFDAMTSDRPYRSGMNYDQAIRILIDGAGAQWDPHMVPIFVDIVKNHLNDIDEICKNNYIDVEQPL